VLRRLRGAAFQRPDEREQTPEQGSLFQLGHGNIQRENGEVCKGSVGVMRERRAMRSAHSVARSMTRC